MKILHIIFSLTTGGAETMLVDIVNEQVNKAEISIIVINCDINHLLLSKVDNRVKVFLLNRKVGSRNVFPLLRLNLLILILKCNVIHCHDQNVIPFLFPSLKNKTVLTIHDVNIPTIHFSKYNKLFAISKVVKEDVKKRCGIDSKLVYNGIYCENVKTSNVINNSTAFFRIVIVSRLRHEKKGQDTAIKALSILKKKGKTNILLDFIGDGPSDQYLKNLSKKNGLENQISFLGVKDKDFVYHTLKDYNLLIQPSLYEGFGLTVAEGMAAKIPVLVSNIEGPMELIDNGKYGYYFEVRNAYSLANMIEFLISNYNSEDMQQIIDSAYVRVKDCYDIKKTASKYFDEYLLN